MNHCRRWIFRKNSTSYDLVAESCAAPEPGDLQPHECLLAIRAVSLNYRDRINWRNLAGRNVEGIVPTSDGAGEILAVGSSVTEFKPGDRVSANFFPTWKSGKFDLRYHQADLGGNLDGMLRDFAVLSESSLVKIPDGWSFAQAATLPCAAVTAWVSLVRRGNLQIVYGHATACFDPEAEFAHCFPALTLNTAPVDYGTCCAPAPCHSSAVSSA
jgi:NADPH:quinone reductase-like Zn-dependent oxidoreductase